MPTYKHADVFLTESVGFPIIDVRAPIEFEQGHIPGATNIPLFDNEQRTEVGTLFRERGRIESVLRALELVGPRMRELAESAMQVANDHKVLVHCWRGGMRSSAFAWLIEQTDLQPIVMQGGYKAYRNHVLESFKQGLNLIVISGLTGAGKTHQLQLLKKQGEQIVDLEQLANHRGSAFGGIGQGDQPTVEQFENELYAVVSNLDPNKRTWIEDESRNVGSARIPHHFFDQIRSAPAIFMDVEQTTRMKLINDEYGDLETSELQAAISRITKRLGGQNETMAIQSLQDGNLNECIGVLLNYYDKLYLENKSKMQREVFVDLTVTNPLSVETTRRLIEIADSFSNSGSGAD